MTTNEPTAQQTYEQRRTDIARVLDWLDLELDRHGTDLPVPNPWNGENLEQLARDLSVNPPVDSARFWTTEAALHQ